MLLEAPLDRKSQPRRTDKSAREATDFLLDHPTAKIVVVIDTHCLDNGYYIWSRDGNTNDFQACEMEEASSMRSTGPSLSSHRHRSSRTAFQTEFVATSPTTRMVQNTTTNHSS